MIRLRPRVASIVFFSTFLVISAATASPVATISGGYDEDSYDTPELIFNNSTAYDFTNAQMVLTPYQPGTLDYSTAPQTVSLGTIGSGTNDTVIWGAGGSFFSNDFDDHWGNSSAGNPLCVQPYPYCALVGNFSVTFTALWANPAYNGGAGIEISSLFSPTSNATGGFVGWEGLDPSGLAETTYDAHSGAITGTLAYINIGPPAVAVPEPSTLSLFGAALFSFAGLAIYRRRKQSGADLAA